MLEAYLHSPNFIVHIVLVIMFATLVAIYHHWKPKGFTLKENLSVRPGLDEYADHLTRRIARGEEVIR